MDVLQGISQRDGPGQETVQQLECETMMSHHANANEWDINRCHLINSSHQSLLRLHVVLQALIVMRLLRKVNKSEAVKEALVLFCTLLKYFHCGVACKAIACSADMPHGCSTSDLAVCSCALENNTRWP